MFSILKTWLLKDDRGLSPNEALQILKSGNRRFAQNKGQPNRLELASSSVDKEQYPFAIVLSCNDSTIPIEQIFAQRFENLLSIRVAGNILTEEALCKMENACQEEGIRIIVVMGHTKCNAVSTACCNMKLGHITTSLGEIVSVVKNLQAHTKAIGVKAMSREEVEQASIRNISWTLDKIRSQSEVLRNLEDSEGIRLMSAVYDDDTHEVNFLKA